MKYFRLGVFINSCESCEDQELPILCLSVITPSMGAWRLIRFEDDHRERIFYATEEVYDAVFRNEEERGKVIPLTEEQVERAKSNYSDSFVFVDVTSPNMSEEQAASLLNI